jgi:hypothetical protein
MGFWGTFCQPRLLPRTRSVPVTKTLPDHNEDRYQQVYENDNFEENKSSFGHEMIAGGAAFAGFKAFEDHQRSEGPCPLHYTITHH